MRTGNGVHDVSGQLVDQNSSLKKEAGIAERKLLARNERIQNLEALLQDADRRLATQNQKFEAQLQAVRERLDQARCQLFMSHVAIRMFPLTPVVLAMKPVTSGGINFGRIAKPLRGGGGTASGTPASPGFGGGSAASPLSRVQSEEGRYVHSPSILDI